MKCLRQASMADKPQDFISGSQRSSCPRRAYFCAAIRLSPRDPGKWSFFLWRATCQAALGDFKAAIEAARQTVRERPDLWLTHITLAITLARAQQIDEAKPVLAKAFQLNPMLSQQEYSEVNALFLSPLRLKELEDVAAHLGLPDRPAPASPAAPPDKPSEPD